MSTVVGGLSSGAAYAKGLWVRLNGGGRRGGGNVASGPLPYQLPAPVATRAQRAAAIAALSKDIDALEQKLQEASKVCAADHITHLCVSGISWDLAALHAFGACCGAPAAKVGSDSFSPLR